MSEKRKPSPNDLAVSTMQSWIETEVVGRNICPPLVKLVNLNRSQSGAIDWRALSPNLVDIEPFLDIKPYKRTELVRETAHSYMRFIEDAVAGTAAYTKMLVLPDFLGNTDYDRFVNAFKDMCFINLIAAQDKAYLTYAVLSRWSAVNGSPIPDLDQMMSTREGQLIGAANVIEGCFNPVYFYGKEVTNRDIADFGANRGPRDRQKILSRAPYYAVQVVNGLAGRDLIGNLNREGLYRRNTDLARETKIKDHEKKMRRLRGEK